MTADPAIILSMVALGGSGAYVVWVSCQVEIAERAAARATEIAEHRMDEINRLAERNIGLRSVNRDLTRQLVRYETKKNRQIAQCRANASAGGKARAAKLKGSINA